MKKKIIAVLLGTMLVGSFAGCGTKDAGEAADATEIAEASETEVTNNEGTDGDSDTEEYVSESRAFDINGADYVVSLCDYDAIPVTLTTDYSVDREDAVSYLEQVIASFDEAYGGLYLPDETKTEVGEGDVVNVDYEGKLDGEAFTGGTATDQNIDVDNNCSVGSYTAGSYIDGFTDDLKGAKVGDVIDSTVTFPEDYGNDELAGKEVVFTFTVNSIQRKVTIDTVDDAFAKDQFQVDTEEEMWQFLENYLTAQAASQRQSDINSAIQDYMLDKCELNLPEDYLEARMNDYRHYFITTNCGGDESQLENYLSTYYGVTVEDAEQTWETGIRKQVGMECIMDAVAEKEGLSFNQDDYDEYVKALIENKTFDSEEDLYSNYGYGDTTYGESYTKRIYVENLALDVIKDKAEITEDVKAATDSESTEAAGSESTEAAGSES